MSDRFVALPVGRGDSFFLRRGSFTALIDGGQARAGFPHIFKDTLHRRGVDVLVCTHNDADHANGILGFLEGGLSCSEVWLPALWNDRLDDLLKASDEFVDELFADIGQLNKQHVADDPDQTIQMSLESLGEIYADSHNGEQLRENEPREPPPPLIMNDANLNASRTAPLNEDIAIAPDIRVPVLFGQTDYEALFLEALTAAKRIRAIAEACIHRNIPIRWFRFSARHGRGGRTGQLVPLNAIEVRRGPRRSRRSISALMYLALTVANRQSLVVCSPPGEHHPGVVFTADSDLSFIGDIPWASGMVITAPHHGSEANAKAYARFRNEAPRQTGIWVRSDGNFRSRPGASYLQETRRYCTVCRSASLQKKAVMLRLRSGR